MFDVDCDADAIVPAAVEDDDLAGGSNRPHQRVMQRME
jgi:hypothetical protein